MFINGTNSIRTTLSRLREEHNCRKMTLESLTQEAQDIGNTLRLKMEQLHAEPTKLTGETMDKVSQATHLSCITPSTLQVHFLEPNTNITEGLFLVDEQSFTNREDSIYTDDLPCTTTANSEDQSKQFMIMRYRNRQPNRVVKPPKNSFEEGHKKRVGWKTKANVAQIICHGCYVPDDHILPDFQHLLTDPGAITKPSMWEAKPEFWTNIML